MSQTIYEVVDKLPAKSLTTRMLGALDWVVPGEWQNVVGFENTIKYVTGETNQARIQKTGERSLKLFNDKTQGYQRALWLYQTVGNVQKLGGFAAFVDKVGESVKFLSFLRAVTPNSDTTQAIDFGVKLAAEVTAFYKLNGIPGDKVTDFVESLADCRHERLMRMAALICVDGLLPLGPDFIQKALSLISKSGVGGLQENKAFEKISSVIPGGTAAKQLGFIEEGISGVSGWMGSFVKEHKLTPDSITDKFRGMIGNMESSGDWIAASIDVTTDYFEHTGVQSVARSLISRAAAEI